MLCLSAYETEMKLDSMHRSSV